MRDEKPVPENRNTIWTARIPENLAKAADKRASSLNLFRSGYVRQLIRKDLKEVGVEVEGIGADTVFD